MPKYILLFNRVGTFNKLGDKYDIPADALIKYCEVEAESREDMLNFISGLSGPAWIHERVKPLTEEMVARAPYYGDVIQDGSEYFVIDTNLALCPVVIRTEGSDAPTTETQPSIGEPFSGQQPQPEDLNKPEAQQEKAIASERPKETSSKVK